MQANWFRITNETEVPSPSLLIFPERIEENLSRMIACVGDVDRLRPHVKTHKLPQVIALEIKHGISKFKVATIAEAEMTAQSGGRDILVAYPQVGPGPNRLTELVKNSLMLCFGRLLTATAESMLCRVPQLPDVSKSMFF